MLRHQVELDCSAAAVRTRSTCWWKDKNAIRRHSVSIISWVALDARGRRRCRRRASADRSPPPPPLSVSLIIIVHPALCTTERQPASQPASLRGVPRQGATGRRQLTVRRTAWRRGQRALTHRRHRQMGSCVRGRHRRTDRRDVTCCLDTRTRSVGGHQLDSDVIDHVMRPLTGTLSDTHARSQTRRKIWQDISEDSRPSRGYHVTYVTQNDICDSRSKVEHKQRYCTDRHRLDETALQFTVRS